MERDACGHGRSRLAERDACVRSSELLGRGVRVRCHAFAILWIYYILTMYRIYVCYPYLHLHLNSSVLACNQILSYVFHSSKSIIFITIIIYCMFIIFTLILTRTAFTVDVVILFCIDFFPFICCSNLFGFFLML